MLKIRETSHPDEELELLPQEPVLISLYTKDSPVVGPGQRKSTVSFTELQAATNVSATKTKMKKMCIQKKVIC